MIVAGMTTRNIAVETLDLVGEARLLKEVQRAVDGGRLGGAFTVKLVDQVIGFGGGRAFKQELKDLAPDPRQLLTALSRYLLSLFEKGFDVRRATRCVRVDVIMRFRHETHVGYSARNVKGQLSIHRRFSGELIPHTEDLEVHLAEIDAQKVLLAHVAYVDGSICDAEIRTAIAMAKECGGFGRLRKADILKELRFLLKHSVSDAVTTLMNSKPRVRERTVQLLWVMAICDGELHPSESNLIYQIADDMKVDRATLALQQPQL